MISSPVELAVEYERPRLNRQGSRGCAGLCRLVDDADFHPSLLSQSARTRPVRPAPMIRTSLCIISSSVHQLRQAWASACHAARCGRAGRPAPANRVDWRRPPPKTSRNNMAITIGLISEKAWKRGSPGATSYTAERLFGPKYYGDDEARMQMALEEIANSGGSFLVAVRLDA
jgi:hypothetical protein